MYLFMSYVYEMIWYNWYVLWFSSMFNEYDHVMLCVFLCHVRRGPSLKPAELSATSDRGHLCTCHSPSMKYIYVIYEMRWQIFLIDACMWRSVTEITNVYSIYIATWSNRGVSTTYWMNVAQPMSFYFSCRSRKSAHVL